MRDHTGSARKTQSNFVHRYQGRLDDPLCPQGESEELMQKKQNGLYPAADFCGVQPPKALYPKLRRLSVSSMSSWRSPAVS